MTFDDNFWKVKSEIQFLRIKYWLNKLLTFRVLSMSVGFWLCLCVIKIYHQKDIFKPAKRTYWLLDMRRNWEHEFKGSTNHEVSKICTNHRIALHRHFLESFAKWCKIITWLRVGKKSKLYYEFFGISVNLCNYQNLGGKTKISSFRKDLYFHDAFDFAFDTAECYIDQRSFDICVKF